MIPALPGDWQSIVGDERAKPYFQALEAYVAAEQALGPVFPPPEEIFAALSLTPYERVRALILGQDPYPTPGHAHGLAFSVRPGVKPPGSLTNIFKELKTDIGCAVPTQNGSLIGWAEQGVLLLNAVLTVRAGDPLSHRAKGWEVFTDEVIRKVSEKRSPVVFVLWGAHAQKKRPLIDTARHAIVTSAHPSPLSARTGFFGSRPFTAINTALAGWGSPPIDWASRDREMKPAP